MGIKGSRQGRLWGGGVLAGAAVAGIVALWAVGVFGDLSADTPSMADGAERSELALAPGVYEYTLDGRAATVHYSSPGRWIKIENGERHDNEDWMIAFDGSVFEYETVFGVADRIGTVPADETVQPEPRIFEVDWWQQHLEVGSANAEWATTETAGNGGNAIRPVRADPPGHGSFVVRNFSAEGLKNPQEVIERLREDPEVEFNPSDKTRSRSKTH